MRSKLKQSSIISDSSYLLSVFLCWFMSYTSKWFETEIQCIQRGFEFFRMPLSKKHIVTLLWPWFSYWLVPFYSNVCLAQLDVSAWVLLNRSVPAHSRPCWRPPLMKHTSGWKMRYLCLPWKTSVSFGQNGRYWWRVMLLLRFWSSIAREMEAIKALSLWLSTWIMFS